MGEISNQAENPAPPGIRSAGVVVMGTPVSVFWTGLLRTMKENR